MAVAAVNHETGVEQDGREAAENAHSRGALLLCDLTQALPRAPVDVAELGADLAAFSAHKPLLRGGDQESGRRAGTPNVPGIAVFGWVLARLDPVAAGARLRELHGALERRVAELLPGARIHGSGAPRAPGITMITHRAIAPGWLARCPGLMASAGASCGSARGE